jgi:N-acetylglucosaminyldiphosphoundecaprenol N-acetyl-beta-D-mannosaminyltransferase
MTPTGNSPTLKQSLSTVTILDVPVHDVTIEDAVQLTTSWLVESGGPLRQVVTVNPEFIMAARRDHEFREILRNADLATADGIGVVLAARVNGARIRERITGVDLTESIAAESPSGARFFLLGGAPGIAEKAAGELRRRFPGVVVAGTFSGSPRDEDAEDVFSRLRVAGANVLLVAFGAPAQDKWVAKHHQKLAEYGIVIGIGVGGTFDYLAGTVPRAPGLIRRIGMEWLYRVIRQPWRWRRQLALPHFAMLVLYERFAGRRMNSTDDNVDLKS